MRDFDFWLNRRRLVAFQVVKFIDLTSLEAFKDSYYIYVFPTSWCRYLKVRNSRCHITKTYRCFAHLTKCMKLQEKVRNKIAALKNNFFFI